MPGKAITTLITITNRIEATHYGHCRPPSKDVSCPWDAFADVDVFVDAVLAELEAMAKDGTRPMRSGPKPPLIGAELRKAGMAIWCVSFCGMQWRPASLVQAR